MTKEQAKHLSEVLKAYSEGKTIQWSWKNCNAWNDITEPWSFETNIDKTKYRIKPELKLRPYKNPDEFFKAQKEHGLYIHFKNTTYYKIPTTIGDTRLGFTFDNIRAVSFSYEEVLDKMIWQDGTPCGILEK